MELQKAGGTLLLEALTSKVIHGAMRVHSFFGPGLLESAYELALCHELAEARLEFRRQVPVPVVYRDLPLDCGFRLDLLVEGTLAVEIKSIERLLRIHESQLMTYLRLANLPVGLLINFNVGHLRHGICRRVMTPESSSEAAHRSASP